jgi:Carboxypeptidase regulatory-like domain/TonB dependent receptor
MRIIKAWLLIAATVFAAAGIAAAQTTTGTISGHVADSQGLPLPGVTINATSPNLQGARTSVTSANGDYTFNNLPSGTYTITFELSGFDKQEKTVTLAPTQTLPLDATMGVASLSEVVNVTQAADVLTNTAQVATNFKQDMIANLPTNRDINASLLLAPSVHPTGPSGAYSIAGSMSFETLYMVNGVSVSENLRGQAYNLYVEDAVQETTVSTSGISAEYGRFGGGVVNVVTKSGGNNFSGSFRDTLLNDNWRTLTPFEKTSIAADPTHKDTRIDTNVPTYEYVMGGPVFRDHLWFFTAGRLQTQEQGRALVGTNVSYPFTDKGRRFEGKGTYSINSNHTFQGAYTKITEDFINATFNTSASMDARSLYNGHEPQNLTTVNYTGVITPTLYVESRFSSRHFSFVGEGSPSTDIINGTLLLDVARGNLRYWSPTFCGVCDPEKRDNTDFFTKGSYFLSTKNAGSHNMTFGYDLFNDKRFANNHQSGSDFRILGTTSIIGADGSVTPEWLGDGTTVIQWNPIPVGSEGTNFRTHSLFINDNWRVNSRFTANLGLRYDRNHGEDSAGRLVAQDAAFSPRVGVVFDPKGDGKWSLTASFAKYVAAISNSVADSSSPAGNPQTFQFAYRGPSINPDGVVVTSTPDAIRQVFDWYNANGGANLPLSGAPNIPGLSPTIQGSLDSPHNLEGAFGINRTFGDKAAFRADYVYRTFRDFYVSVLNTSTGRVQDQLGKSYDLALIQNSNDLERKYQGVTMQGTYRFTPVTNIGATYTVSHAWGNVEGENVNSGPTTSGVFQYPEYKQASWDYPVGDLSIDQRHRARLWVIYGIPHLEDLSVSAVQTLTSGVPYGEVAGTPTQAFVQNPGYLTPPGNTGSSAVPYYFSARDAFRTAGEKRTDLAVNYVYRLKAAHNAQLFGQLQVINVFDNADLCGCGGTVFQNGGSVTQTRIDQTVRTASTNAALYTAFNPFTTAPVEGVNFAKGPNFGTALNRFAYTTPRMLRISFGIRF